MRRSTILKSVTTVIDSLTSSNLLSVLKEAMEGRRARGDKPQFDTNVLISLTNFATKYGQFTDAEIEIASIIGISEYANPANWEDLVQQKETPMKLYEAHTAVNFAIEYLPKFLEIVMPSYAKFDFKQGEPQPIPREGRGIISVALYDNEGAPFTTDRFISLFTSMSVLYNVSSQILNQEKESLILLGCDSGDVKVFDFEGAGDAIKNVKETILSLWDMIVYHRQHKTNISLNLLTKGLPILEQIQQLKKADALEPEEAEILKKKVISAIGQFIECGATTPEMDDIRNIQPHLLMTPEPKQITQGEDAANKHD